MNNNYDSLIEKAIQSNGSATELRTCTVTYSAQNSTRAPETHLVGNTVNSSPACSRPFNPVYAESASWGFTTTQNACRRSATVQQLLKTDISTGLGNAVHQRAYQALIDHTFCSFSQEKRINILEQLDIDYKQMSSGASNFVVANISSDCKITALTALYTDLKAKNLAVINAETPLNNARIARNDVMYKDNVGLVDVAADVKTYIKSVFGATSPQYKTVSSLKFTKYNN